MPPKGPQAATLAGTQDRPRFRNETEVVDEVQNEGSHRLLEFWAQHSQDGRLLSRAAIPSREILDLMGNLFLVEPVDAEGSDWRFRLAGEVLNARFGQNPTGRCVSELHTLDLAPRTIGRYNAVAKGRVPLILRGRLLGLGRDFYEIEIVQLPFLANDGHTIGILGGIFFLN
jgi:hypothetical protein